MKMIEIAINNAIQDYVINNDGKGLIIDLDYNVPFKSNKGHFKVNLEKAITSWTIQEFKRFVSIIDVSVEPFQAASFTHDFIVSIVDSLAKSKAELIGNAHVTDRKDIDTFINRLFKFNEVLVDKYGVEPLQVEKAPSYKKCTVYALVNTNEGIKEIKTFNGYQFVKNGYTFQVYKAENSTLKYIIFPSCGSSIGTTFKGDYKTAHEYVDTFLNAMTKDNASDNVAAAEKLFNEVAHNQGIELPEICKPLFFNVAIDIVNQVTNEPTNEPIYDNENDYSDKVRYFDEHINELKSIIDMFNSYREDFISSDREAAAFILTLEHYTDLGYTTADNDNKIASLFPIEVSNEVSVESVKRYPNNRLKLSVLKHNELITENTKKAILNGNLKALTIDTLPYNSPITLTTGPG